MNYTALYREWRPETFDDMVGQDTIVQTLENQIKSGRIGHAYLFSGPRGTGKTSTAKIFANAVNCLQTGSKTPCGECEICQRAKAGNTMDIIEIDAASNNGVDEIRSLRDKAKFPPALGRYKVYIIDEVHMLSAGAFNALLKTLEEPPSHIIFILATTEAHKLPATIISRCQRYDFKLIILNDIVGQLRKISAKMNIKIEEEALYTIARWAEGGMRDALSLLDQCIGFCGDRVSNDDVLAILGTANEAFMFEMADFLLDGDGVGALRGVSTLIGDGRDISVFVKDIITHMRNLLIIKTCNNSASGLIDASPATIELYESQAKSAGEMRVFRAVEMFVELESELKWASQPRVLLELAIARLCRPEEEKDHESLLDRIETLEKSLKNIDHQSIEAKPTSEDNKKKIEPEIEAQIDPEPVDTKDIDEKASEQEKAQSEPKRAEKASAEAKSSQSDNIDIVGMWPQILKMIRKERMPIYSLIMKAEFKQRTDSSVTLVFPPDQGFFVTAVEKEENRNFIEEIIHKATGLEVRLQCVLEGQDGEALAGEDPLVQKAIDIFGKENVDIIDE